MRASPTDPKELAAGLAIAADVPECPMSSRPWRSLLSLTSLAVTIVASVSGAQTLPPLTPLLPTALASARPHGLELASTVPPGLTWSMTLAYGNAFAAADEVHSAHQATGQIGEPLSDAAWDAAVASRDGLTTWAVDLEMMRLDLEAAIGFAGGLSTGLRAPVWWSAETPLDSWPGRWHRAIGVGDAGRELYADRRSVFRLARGETQLDLSGAVDPELGDLSAWAAWSLPAWGPLEPRAWVSVTIPTGGDFGAGGWAGGLRWGAALDLGRVRLDGGLGLTVVEDVPGPWPASNPLWHAWIGGDLRLSGRWSFGLLARSDASAYRESLSDRPASASAELAIGPSIRIADAVWIQVALGEDFPGMGLAPDFSIQTRLVIRPAGHSTQGGTRDRREENHR